MKTAMLIHPNGLAELVQDEQWGEDEIARVLQASPSDIENYLLDGKLGKLLLWQVNDLHRDRPVNKPAELLLGESNYFHLRGQALVTNVRVNTGLSPETITKLTVRLGTQREEA